MDKTVNPAAERIHHRICPLCEACCGLEVRTRGTRITGIRGAEDDVFSRGYICPKGYALKDLHEDPDRLRTPLVRRNGELQPASWDEAFAEIERRLLPILAAHGRDAVALSVGNPSAHKMGLLLYFNRMAKALGITQDGVSRLEKRSDLLLSTLRKSVQAMGGTLSLVAEFPDRDPVVLSGIADDDAGDKVVARRHAPA